MYNLTDFQLKFCFEPEYSGVVLSIAIAEKNKFFSIFYQDYQIHIYQIDETLIIGGSSNCECAKNLYKEGINKPQKSATAMIFGALSKLIRVN